MSNDNKHPTSLEHLPVEILLQIFAFFPLPELVKAFSGLNTYVDSVIRSIRNTSLVVRSYDIDAINLLHTFSTQIARLVINAPTINFTPLINLRSLTLKYATQIQFDSIRPEHFPLLQILLIKGTRQSCIEKPH